MSSEPMLIAIRIARSHIKSTFVKSKFKSFKFFNSLGKFCVSALLQILSVPTALCIFSYIFLKLSSMLFLPSSISVGRYFLFPRKVSLVNKFILSNNLNGSVINAASLSREKHEWFSIPSLIKNIDANLYCDSCNFQRYILGESKDIRNIFYPHNSLWLDTVIIIKYT